METEIEVEAGHGSGVVPGIGSLSVTVNRGRFSEAVQLDMEMLGKQDPRIEFVYNGVAYTTQSAKTETHAEGENEPVWDQVFVLEDVQEHLGDELVFAAKAEDGAERSLGQTVNGYTVQGFLEDHVQDWEPHEHWLRLVDEKQEPVGEVLVTLQAIKKKKIQIMHPIEMTREDKINMAKSQNFKSLKVTVASARFARDEDLFGK